MYEITKTLSANDTGETGAHQAGVLVPKDPHIFGFFPPLDDRQKNPRCMLVFRDDGGMRWEFAFIYYNNRLFGGTRNEYRLTRMTEFIRANNLREGDVIVLRMDTDGTRRISFRRSAGQRVQTGDGVLRLGSGWKVISI